jgi:hypothetical protein
VGPPAWATRSQAWVARRTYDVHLVKNLSLCVGLKPEEQIPRRPEGLLGMTTQRERLGSRR